MRGTNIFLTHTLTHLDFSVSIVATCCSYFCRMFLTVTFFGTRTNYKVHVKSYREKSPIWIIIMQCTNFFNRRTCEYQTLSLLIIQCTCTYHYYIVHVHVYVLNKHNDLVQMFYVHVHVPCIRLQCINSHSKQ